VPERERTIPNAMVVWLAIVRTRQAVDRFGRRSLDHLGLGLTDFAILESVLHLGPLTPSQLGERVGLTRGSITSAVDRLGARGLLTREPNSADARSSLIQLTPAGAQVIEAAWKSHSDDVDRVLSEALIAEEMAVLFKLLGRVRRAANSLTSGNAENTI
jgi:MarR family transcriptional regulator, 2-MHQ and catechol-resistance regulon repressor